jgi:hypothetical protein
MEPKGDGDKMQAKVILSGYRHGTCALYHSLAGERKRFFADNCLVWNGIK